MSSKINLLPGEKIVTSSDNGILILTTKRVRYDSVVWGKSHLVSITLSSVASCGLATMSFPVLLLLAAIAAGYAIVLQGDAFALSLGASIVGVVTYFLTRRVVISIASNGGQNIMVPIKGMKREAAVGFIDAVEAEKLK